MADSVVIREFLVALGFKVDEKGLKNFKEGVEGTTKGVKQLIATVSGAALTVSAGVAAFASKLERLYFVSQRTGASATNLRGFEFAARNMGVSAEAATGTIENLARFLRNNPAGEGYLATLGVQTRNANGELRDTVDIMSDLGKSLANKPTWLASQYGNILGIDENLMLAMRNGDYEKLLAQYREMSKSTGLDKAADDSHRFMTQLRGLGTSFENLGIRVEGAMLQKIGPQLERFQRWMDEHGDEIANRITDIANAVVKAAAAMGPPLAWLADKFVELDHGTNGWSTKILLLGVALNALGVFKIVRGIWKAAAALRAMGAAGTGTASVISGLIGSVGGLITLLGRLSAIAGAAFAGWKIGDALRDSVDGWISKASGGRFRSIWDVLTGKDRRGLDATGGYTQEEIDSVKDGGGVKLTPPRAEQSRMPAPLVTPEPDATEPAEGPQEPPARISDSQGATPQPQPRRLPQAQPPMWPQPVQQPAAAPSPAPRIERVAVRDDGGLAGRLGQLADTAFGKLIARGEGDYNSVNRGARGGYRAGTENLEGMTLAQVMAAQRAGQFNAAGRYQIIGSTLAEAARGLRLNGSEMFDRKLQDRIFEQYLVRNKRRAIADYVEGRSDDLRGALRAASREWASVADPDTGRSYYAGKGNNRASITAAEMAAALRNTRATYQPPAALVAQPAARGGAAKVELHQSTQIHVTGASDPSAAGRAVEREQRAVNADMVRNLQGVIA
ncbi:mannosyl-glycoprotein endo-beta-N-acetylglucosamidase [Burkholderia cenocepacia]|uniref:mannosyl-glycoprotein endo-beta-N-acetylglucosamidase n=1 Tax=Burkholderia cenocepacia TaxID=95486 RepID=UPI00223037D2|nr:mannosyl-glycoprotein endo-beta-N-acetylglucosamidase [Burkholderia cenocepacia]MCW3522138.1 mannosyl-glycoprotein endo-beta-N-acetylglucosamidase [Burkholderia cenocepacia]MCW3617986.1 mannosyl-glycoprotein endo-beta-N-acetylglucosamidase [Burkholderia cenocepacia]MCW3655881.1 mannosyl-glycoprotein endo-beta-N-acetylglucosamidase [Burkholderia cenocepacia]MCW3670896.1 mannosyl-glycoprotein endo-beta-N-acetylglucosamidase [Burkholderia cenocepacia]MCW3685609.1 mannosyl-glycoprotein endo-bet